MCFALSATHNAPLGSGDRAELKESRSIRRYRRDTGCETEEAWVLTSRTVVTVASAVAKKKAAAIAANAIRRRITLPPMMVHELSGLDGQRRNFAVEPILLGS